MATKRPENTGRKTGSGREATQFKPGVDWTGNAAGRPKGSRNKLCEDYYATMLRLFEEGGEKALRDVMENQPAQFMQAIGKILPAQVGFDEDHADSFLDVLKALGRASRSRDE
jgi:hypothetical protein